MQAPEDGAPVVAGTITLSAPGSVSEGGSIVYTATVDVPPQGSALVLTLTNGLTVTIPVGALSGTSAPLLVRPDDVHAQGDVPLTASVRGASGGDFTSLARAQENHVARLHIDGTIDTNFNVGLGPDQAVRAVALQPDGKAIIAGAFTNVSGVPEAGPYQALRELSDGKAVTPRPGRVEK